MNKKANTNSSKQNPDELYFSWYLEELKTNGYIKEYEREPETMIVIPTFKYKREKHYKSKENVDEDFTLAPALTYTYDYRIIWTKQALNLFTEIMYEGGSFRFGQPEFVSHYMEIRGEMEIVSYVDVKPPSAVSKFAGGKLSTFYTFPLIQKFLLYNNGLYINKTVVKNSGKHSKNTNLFAKTFTPNRYKFTDKGQQLRQIPFKAISLSSYVESKRKIINSLLEDIRKKESKKSQQKLL